MFIRDACQCVVYCFYPAGSQIAVGIESIEVGTEGRVLPCSLFGSADPTVCRRTGHSHDVEAILHRLKRFVWEQGFACDGGIFIESFHFTCGIPFCQDGYIDTLFFISTFQQILVRSDVCEPFFVYQNVVGLNDVLQVGTDFAFVIA